MNLKKLFHFNYLKQNLKKSRVVLAFVLLILPILNLLTFFMQVETSRINIFGLNDISTLANLGMYVIPVVLSIILFNYVFKKKSIDFIGSMPLDRKTIFVTNTIGGIFIILSLIFITTFLIFLVSAFLPNVYVPFGVFIDYFVVYSLSYIFVFSVVNLALSLAGNVPTTLVVSALILFLLPFLHFVNISFNDNIDNYYYKCDTCVVDTNLFGMREIPVYHYTTPSQVIVNTITYTENSLYKDAALGKTALLTILYILTGLMMFQKKELEITETSFKSKNVHVFVKGLTLIPCMIIVYKIMENATSFIGVIFVLALLLIYYFVYDLITKRSITDVRFNLAIFLLTVILLTPFSALILNEFSSDKNIILKSSDITSIKIEDASIPSLKAIGGEFTTSNKKIIDLIFTDTIDKSNYIGRVTVYMNGKEYEKNVLLSDENLEKLDSLIEETNEYKKQKENKFDGIEIVTVGNNVAKLETKDIQIFKNASKNEDKEKNIFFLPLYVYTYENHELTKQTFYSNLNKELNQIAVDRYNETFKNKLKNNDFESIRFMYIEDEYKGNYYHYNTSKEYQLIFDLLKTQSTNVNDKLYKFEVYTNENMYYYYANLEDSAKEKLEIKKDVLDDKDIVVGED